MNPPPDPKPPISGPATTPKPARSPKPRAYSYLRFSRPEQMAGDSQNRQTQASEAYAREHDLELDTSLNLKDLGVSAFRGKNATEGALAAFLDAIKSGKIPKGSVLLVESLDRLSRDQVTSAMTQFLNIITAGITVVTLMDGMSYSEASIAANPGNLMLSLVVMMRAHDESASKSKRLVHVWSQKRKQAQAEKKPLSALCPAWITLTKDKGYELIPERVEIIKRIFQLACLMGNRRICNELNKEGIAPFGKSIKSKKKDHGWHPSYIQKILSNRSVLGYYQPHKMDPETGKRIPDGEEIANYFPAAITAKEWTDANTSHGDRKLPTGPAGEKVSNLFSGLVIDGYTGCVMRYTDKGRKKSKDGRYLVSDSTRLKPGTKGQTWPYGHFEKIALKHIKELDWASLVTTTSDDEVTNLQNLCSQYQLRIDDMSREINRLIDFSHDIPESLLATIKEKTSNLALEQDKLRLELKKAQANLDAVISQQASMTEGIEEFRALVAAGDPNSRQKLRYEIRKRIKQIFVYRHGNAPSLKDLDQPSVQEKPVIEFKLASGKSITFWLSRIGPDPFFHVHHARTQPRDPKTGAFIKQTC
jgi:DNA invertase Pin-like site-specific DNA recombinase